MTVVGINFTKIVVEKGSAIKGKIDISNNVSLKNVESTDFSFGKTKQDGIKFTFEFVSKYEPDVGSMNFNGEVLYLGEPKKNEEILKNWKKDKKLPKELLSEILNGVLIKCNIEALILSKEVNLPPPVPLPRIEEGQEKA